MPTDALDQVQASVTKTATFSSAAFTLPAGTPRRGLKMRVLYSNALNTSASDTIIWSVDVSHDGGSNFYTEAESDPITLTTTAQAGELFIPFEVSPTSVANQIQFKLTIIFSGTGHGDTATYQGDLVLSRP